MAQNPNEIIIPPKTWLDKLSNDYAIGVANLKLLAELKGSIDQLNKSLPIILSSSLQDKAALESGAVLPYQVFRISLATVFADAPYPCQGFMTVLAFGSDGLVDSVSLKFNTQQANNVPLAAGINPIPMSFYRFYLTNSLAQPGKTLTIFCSNGNPNVGTGNQAKKPTTGAPQIIFNAAFGAIPIGTYLSLLLDCQGVNRILLFAISTLDVPVALQAMGNIENVPATSSLINGLIPCPIGSVITTHVGIGLAYDDWHPYVGAQVGVAVNPTVGSLIIYAVVQE